MKDKKISVIIPVYNALKYTIQCIESLWFNNPDLFIELIVIDDCSTEVGIEEFLAKLKDHTIIRHKKRQGFIKSVNEGLELATCDYILLLNNDTYIPPNAIGNLIECLDSNQHFGMVGPSTNFAHSKQQIELVEGYDSLDSLKNIVERLMIAAAKRYDEVTHLIGMCLLFRRSFYEDLKEDYGLFDPRFGLGNYEDVDLCRRTLERGYKLIVARDSYIHHYGTQGFGQDMEEYRKLMKENEEIFRKKWSKHQRVIAMICVQNGGEMFREVLHDVSQYVDGITILDDNSTDNTIDIAREFDKVLLIHQNVPGLKRHEGRDRNKLLQLTLNHKPDWLLCLDADEIFEDSMKENIQRLCNPLDQTVDGYSFRFYNFWRSRESFRVDGIWRKQQRFKLFRVKPEYSEFPMLQLHAPSRPTKLKDGNIRISKIRLKHFGYSDFEETKRKYEFYEKEDKVKDKDWIGGEDYSHLINEENLELLDWVESPEVQKSISLCMIVRDEEKNLPRCLDSVKGLFDEIIVVDTGSKDKTIEIAKSYGAKVIEREWRDDFAWARNEGIKIAKSDFIMWLDADDTLRQEDHNKIKRIINKLEHIAAYTQTKNTINGKEVDANSLPRIFKNHRGIKFFGEIHEDIVLPPNRKILITDIPVFHHGYSDLEKKLLKNERNIRILLKQINNNKNDPRPHFFLGRSYRMTGQCKLSIKHLKKYLKLEKFTAPLRYTAMVDQANNFIQLGCDQDAVLMCYKAQSLNNTLATAYCTAGQAFINMGKLKNAEIVYQVALSLKCPKFETNPVYPQDYDFLPAWKLAEIYYKKRDINKCLHFLELALSFRPNNRIVIERILKVGSKFLPQARILQLQQQLSKLPKRVRLL